MLDKGLETKLEAARKPINCLKCGEAYVYKSLGVYECPKCGYVEKDEYALVREYIEANGAASSVTISAATGVPIARINQLLRNGKLEIQMNLLFFIKCENCSTDIRFGRFCPACAAMSAQLQALLLAPWEKHNPVTGKMRFLINR